MLLEIDHGIGFTTRRAVITAEAELVMRVADLPGRLLLALPISREQRRPVNGDLPRTAPRGSLERFVQAPQMRCLQGIHTYGEQRRAADCLVRSRGMAWGVAVANQGSIRSTLSGVPSPLYIDLRGGLNT